MDLNTVLAIVALVSAFGSAGISWGVLSERMKHMRERQKEIESKQDEQGKELVRGQVRFERIEGKLDSIHDDLSDMKKLLETAIGKAAH